MLFKITKVLVIIFFFVLFIVGCGGGNSGSSINPVPITPDPYDPNATTAKLLVITSPELPGGTATAKKVSASGEIIGSAIISTVLDGHGKGELVLPINELFQIDISKSDGSHVTSRNVNLTGNSQENFITDNSTPTPQNTPLPGEPTWTPTIPQPSFTPQNTPLPGEPTWTPTTIVFPTNTPPPPTVGPGTPTATSIPPTNTPVAPTSTNTPSPTATATNTVTATPTTAATPNPVLLSADLLGLGKIETAASNGLLILNGKIYIGDGSKAKRFDLASKNKDGEQAFPDIGTIVQGITTDGTDIYVLVHTGHWYKCNSDLNLQNSYSCPLNARDIIYHQGKIFISCEDDKNIKVYDTDGTFNKNIGSSSVLNKPHGLAFDSNNNLFVTDVNGKKVVKFDPLGTFLENIAITSGLYRKCDLSAKHIYISDTLSEIIRILNIDTKTDTAPIPVTDSVIEDMYIDSNMLYLLDSYNKKIILFSI